MGHITGQIDRNKRGVPCSIVLHHCSDKLDGLFGLCVPMYSC